MRKGVAVVSWAERTELLLDQVVPYAERLFAGRESQEDRDYMREWFFRFQRHLEAAPDVPEAKRLAAKHGEISKVFQARFAWVFDQVEAGES